MGKVFTSTVFLIVCAEVFAAGLTKSGGIAEIINSVSGMQAGGYAVFTVMFLIVVGSAFVMGSGNAAFFSFAPMIPDIAAKVGLNAAFMISPLQLASGMARSSSPIAGVTIAIAGLSGLNPFDLMLFLPIRFKPDGTDALPTYKHLHHLCSPAFSSSFCCSTGCLQQPYGQASARISPGHPPNLSGRRSPY